MFRKLGHHATIVEESPFGNWDLLIALHAEKSAKTIQEFSTNQPDRPIVVVITGTDLYGDERALRITRESCQRAERILFLRTPMPGDLQLLGKENFEQKVRVIYQSSEPPVNARVIDFSRFDVCVIGHLRPIKDPFRTAEAVRGLPSTSRFQVHHLGAALSPEMASAARQEAVNNPRYHWLGEVPHDEALSILSGCRLLVMTSINEGGPSAVSEALACGVPVISSRVPGVVGLLGHDYPGYFEVGVTDELRNLLLRCETDPDIYRSLAKWCESRRHLVTPDEERRRWHDLLNEFNY